ncbi:MAG: hypothetical protein FJ222_01260 [Lentisphaerae bacterium]|nr:hypothetical protein [Lentisphaerota bacterium]
MQTLVTHTKQEEIKARLVEIERIEGVRILYACESGSRAWGFPYALRPLLACLWLEQGRGPVPTEFQTLVKTVVRPGPLLDAINGLLESKRQGHELGEGARIPAFDDFL